MFCTTRIFTGQVADPVDKARQVESCQETCEALAKWIFNRRLAAVSTCEAELYTINVTELEAMGLQSSVADMGPSAILVKPFSLEISE